MPMEVRCDDARPRTHRTFKAPPGCSAGALDPVCLADLVLRGVGCGVESDGRARRGLPRHLRHDERPVLARAVRVLRCLLLPRDPGRVHREPLGIQGGDAGGPRARGNRGRPVLPGQPRLAVRDVPSRAVRARIGAVGAGDVREPVRPLARTGGDRDEPAQSRAGVQPDRRERRRLHGRDAHPAAPHAGVGEGHHERGGADREPACRSSARPRSVPRDCGGAPDDRSHRDVLADLDPQTAGRRQE